MNLSNGPRYIVGIDLGTTNSAVGFLDTRSSQQQVQTFAVPQLVAPGTVEKRDSLPSFYYDPAREEFDDAMLALPWMAQNRKVVGMLAREHGAAVPGRLVVSAKSWLSHAGVDRKAELLPWHGAADVEKQSPGQVSSAYLHHIRQAWDAEFPGEPLAEQDVVLTVPASFDEVARELTVEAAKMAGLPKICLLEEPQAAFYAWMSKHRKAAGMQSGESILVCDIGGGTTDLTLITVEKKKDEGLSYRRVAVGDHLLLGGDNLDLALAHHVEAQLGGGKMAPATWSVLVRRCQQAKETLLSAEAPDSVSINLPARGRSVIGGSRQATVTRGEVVELLVEGFLPAVTPGDRPELHRSGFQEFGLPYAPDPAISRYVMAFLAEHAEQAGSERPDHVLFNGGFFESRVLRERLLDVLEQAFSWKPNVLPAARLDLAVAHGAAEYGRVRRGQGARITGGLARTYYLGVGVENGQTAAVCLLPAGLEEGAEVALSEQVFQLQIRQPVEFPLFTSSIRTQDKPGELVEVDEETMRPMPSIKTVITSGKKKSADAVAVLLHAKLTEIGTMELWCAEVNGRREWRLQFDVRAATQTEREVEEAVGNRAGVVDEALARESIGVLEATLGVNRSVEPNQLFKQLEKTTGLNRNQWPPALLRSWSEAVLPLEACRSVLPELEARWLNLLGYALRPGYGFAADDWRVSLVWRIQQNGVVNGKNEMCRAEWWILWRRIAGGLNENQQSELANPLIKAWRGRIRSPKAPKGKVKNFQFGDHESAEVWRLLGSLERLPVAQKEELGELLLIWLERKGRRISNGAAVWALGRLGARQPVYGPLNAVVNTSTVEGWSSRLMALSGGKKETAFALMQMARKTDDRYRDLSDEARIEILAWLTEQAARPRLIELVREGGLLDAEEQDRSFGEALPPGLHLAG